MQRLCLNFKSLLLKQKGYHCRKSTLSKLELLNAWNDEFLPEVSRDIAISIIRYISTTNVRKRETWNFLNEIRRKIQYLHQYNCNVAKVKGKFPHSKQLDSLLVRYVELEYEVLYNPHNYSEKNQKVVEEKVLQLLQHIMYDATKDTNMFQKDIVIKSAKALLKLIISIKEDYRSDKKLVCNILNKVLVKANVMEEVKSFNRKRISMPAGELFKDPDVQKLHKNLTTSDYGTDESEADCESDSEVSSVPQDTIPVSTELPAEVTVKTEEEDEVVIVDNNKREVYTFVIADSDEEDDGYTYMTYLSAEVESSKKKCIDSVIKQDLIDILKQDCSSSATETQIKTSDASENNNNSDQSTETIVDSTNNSTTVCEILTDDDDDDVVVVGETLPSGDKNKNVVLPVIITKTDTIKTEKDGIIICQDSEGEDDDVIPIDKEEEILNKFIENDQEITSEDVQIISFKKTNDTSHIKVFSDEDMKHCTETQAVNTTHIKVKDIIVLKKQQAEVEQNTFKLSENEDSLLAEDCGTCSDASEGTNTKQLTKENVKILEAEQNLLLTKQRLQSESLESISSGSFLEESLDEQNVKSFKEDENIEHNSNTSKLFHLSDKNSENQLNNVPVKNNDDALPSNNQHNTFCSEINECVNTTNKRITEEAFSDNSLNVQKSFKDNQNSFEINSKSDDPVCSCKEEIEDLDDKLDEESNSNLQNNVNEQTDLEIVDVIDEINCIPESEEKTSECGSEVCVNVEHEDASISDAEVISNKENTEPEKESEDIVAQKEESNELCHSDKNLDDKMKIMDTVESKEIEDNATEKNESDEKETFPQDVEGNNDCEVQICENVIDVAAETEIEATSGNIEVDNCYLEEENLPQVNENIEVESIELKDQINEVICEKTVEQEEEVNTDISQCTNEETNVTELEEISSIDNKEVQEDFSADDRCDENALIKNGQVTVENVNEVNLDISNEKEPVFEENVENTDNENVSESVQDVSINKEEQTCSNDIQTEDEKVIQVCEENEQGIVEQTSQLPIESKEIDNVENKNVEVESSESSLENTNEVLSKEQYSCSKTDLNSDDVTQPSTYNINTETTCPPKGAVMQSEIFNTNKELIINRIIQDETNRFQNSSASDNEDSNDSTCLKIDKAALYSDVSDGEFNECQKDSSNKSKKSADVTKEPEMKLGANVAAEQETLSIKNELKSGKNQEPVKNKRGRKKKFRRKIGVLNKMDQKSKKMTKTRKKRKIAVDEDNKRVTRNSRKNVVNVVSRQSSPVEVFDEDTLEMELTFIRNEDFYSLSNDEVNIHIPETTDGITNESFLILKQVEELEIVSSDADEQKTKTDHSIDTIFNKDSSAISVPEDDDTTFNITSEDKSDEDINENTEAPCGDEIQTKPDDSKIASEDNSNHLDIDEEIKNVPEASEFQETCLNVLEKESDVDIHKTVIKQNGTVDISSSNFEEKCDEKLPLKTKAALKSYEKFKYNPYVQLVQLPNNLLKQPQNDKDFTEDDTCEKTIIKESLPLEVLNTDKTKDFTNLNGNINEILPNEETSVLKLNGIISIQKSIKSDEVIEKLSTEYEHVDNVENKKQMIENIDSQTDSKAQLADIVHESYEEKIQENIEMEKESEDSNDKECDDNSTVLSENCQTNNETVCDNLEVTALSEDCQNNENLPIDSEITPSVEDCQKIETLAMDSETIPSIEDCQKNETLPMDSEITPSIEDCQKNETLCVDSETTPSIEDCQNNKNLPIDSEITPSIEDYQKNETLSMDSETIPSIEDCQKNETLSVDSEITSSIEDCQKNEILCVDSETTAFIEDCQKNETLSVNSEITPSTEDCQKNEILCDELEMTASSEDCQKNQALSVGSEVTASFEACESNKILCDGSKITAPSEDCQKNECLNDLELTETTKVYQRENSSYSEIEHNDVEMKNTTEIVQEIKTDKHPNKKVKKIAVIENIMINNKAIGIQILSVLENQNMMRKGKTSEIEQPKKKKLLEDKQDEVPDISMTVVQETTVKDENVIKPNQTEDNGPSRNEDLPIPTQENNSQIDSEKTTAKVIPLACEESVETFENEEENSKICEVDKKQSEFNENEITCNVLNCEDKNTEENALESKSNNLDISAEKSTKKVTFQDPICVEEVFYSEDIEENDSFVTTSKNTSVENEKLLGQVETKLKQTKKRRTIDYIIRNLKRKKTNKEIKNKKPILKKSISSVNSKQEKGSLNVSTVSKVSLPFPPPDDNFKSTDQRTETVDADKIMETDKEKEQIHEVSEQREVVGVTTDVDCMLIKSDTKIVQTETSNKDVEQSFEAEKEQKDSEKSTTKINKKTVKVEKMQECESDDENVDMPVSSDDVIKDTEKVVEDEKELSGSSVLAEDIEKNETNADILDAKNKNSSHEMKVAGVTSTSTEKIISEEEYEENTCPSLSLLNREEKSEIPSTLNSTDIINSSIELQDISPSKICIGSSESLNFIETPTSLSIGSSTESLSITSDVQSTSISAINNEISNLVRDQLLLSSNSGLGSRLDTSVSNYSNEVQVSSEIESQQPNKIRLTMIQFEPMDHNYSVGGPLLSGNNEKNELKEETNEDLAKLKEGGSHESSSGHLDNSSLVNEHIFSFSGQDIDGDINPESSRSLDDYSVVDTAVDYQFAEQDNQFGFGFIMNNEAGQSLEEAVVDTNNQCIPPLDFVKQMQTKYTHQGFTSEDFYKSLDELLMHVETKHSKSGTTVNPSIHSNLEISHNFPSTVCDLNDMDNINFTDLLSVNNYNDLPKSINNTPSKNCIPPDETKTTATSSQSVLGNEKVVVEPIEQCIRTDIPDSEDLTSTKVNNNVAKKEKVIKNKLDSQMSRYKLINAVINKVKSVEPHKIDLNMIPTRRHSRTPPKRTLPPPPPPVSQSSDVLKNVTEKTSPPETSNNSIESKLYPMNVKKNLTATFNNIPEAQGQTSPLQMDAFDKLKQESEQTQNIETVSKSKECSTSSVSSSEININKNSKNAEKSSNKFDIVNLLQKPAKIEEVNSNKLNDVKLPRRASTSKVINDNLVEDQDKQNKIKQTLKVDVAASRTKRKVEDELPNNFTRTKIPKLDDDSSLKSTLKSHPDDRIYAKKIHITQIPISNPIVAESVFRTKRSIDTLDNPVTEKTKKLKENEKPNSAYYEELFDQLKKEGPVKDILMNKRSSVEDRADNNNKHKDDLRFSQGYQGSRSWHASHANEGKNKTYHSIEEKLSYFYSTFPDSGSTSSVNGHNSSLQRHSKYSSSSSGRYTSNKSMHSSHGESSTSSRYHHQPFQSSRDNNNKHKDDLRFSQGYQGSRSWHASHANEGKNKTYHSIEEKLSYFYSTFPDRLPCIQRSEQTERCSEVFGTANTQSRKKYATNHRSNYLASLDKFLPKPKVSFTPPSPTHSGSESFEKT